MCQFSRILLRLMAGFGILLGIANAVGPVARAQGPAQQPSNRSAQAPGSWTIAVVTSTGDPASKRLLESLRSNAWVRANNDRVKLAELNSDAISRPSIGSSTAVLVYQPGPRGPEMVAGRSGFNGADDVILWVRKVVVSATETSIHDPNLTQATMNDKSLPSAQAPTYQTPQPQPQAPQPQSPAYPQAYLPQSQMTTTYAMPMAPSPATMIQAPQQHLVIQQPPTQVMFAPPSAPMVYLPQAPAPTANLYMQAVPTASQPMMMVAPQPMAVAPQPVAVAPQPVAVAPQPAAIPVGPSLTGAALTTSSFSVPASSTTSRVRVRGPGPVASALSRFGERLTTLGRTRIESVQETRLETQIAQTPPGQYMTLSSTSASPLLSQPQTMMTPQPVSQSAPPLPYCPPPQGPQPSPQGSHR